MFKSSYKGFNNSFGNTGETDDERSLFYIIPINPNSKQLFGFHLDKDKIQKSLRNLQGQNRTWFSGSYFGYGFHEDGLKSSLEMLKQFEGKDGDLYIQRHSYASKI